MNKNLSQVTVDEVLEAISKNPVFYLATVDEQEENINTSDNHQKNQQVYAHVRGMLLYRADHYGILFHTAKTKEVFPQLMKHPEVELCFNAEGVQIRISGETELVEDVALKDEIAADPTRGFLQPWIKQVGLEEYHEQLAVFRLSKGIITFWTMERNLDSKITLDFDLSK